jgi:hypothetical protein
VKILVYEACVSKRSAQLLLAPLPCHLDDVDDGLNTSDDRVRGAICTSLRISSLQHHYVRGIEVVCIRELGQKFKYHTRTI